MIKKNQEKAYVVGGQVLPTRGNSLKAFVQPRVTVETSTRDVDYSASRNSTLLDVYDHSCMPDILQCLFNKAFHV